MNKKFVYQVGNNKKSYTMMHGQPNIKNYVTSFMSSSIQRKWPNRIWNGHAFVKTLIQRHGFWGTNNDRSLTFLKKEGSKDS